jgi:hypothetical protein
MPGHHSPLTRQLRPIPRHKSAQGLANPDPLGDVVHCITASYRLAYTIQSITCRCGTWRGCSIIARRDVTFFSISSVAMRQQIDIVGLVTRAQSGDRQAYSELYAHFQPGVYAVALACLRDTQAAQELTHDVLVCQPFLLP